ncbi:MAG: hypothetical protein SA339_06730 [Methanomassiliicoccus sp.]|nr:hypothetical protein [Methanomassiliicoccus sp.]
MIDLEELITHRMEAIQATDVDYFVDFEIMGAGDSEYGVIAVLGQDGAAHRFEFLESAISWMRPEAIDEYNEIADDGVPVTVIVPNDAFLAMSERVQKYGSTDIAVFGYDAILAYA